MTGKNSSNLYSYNISYGATNTNQNSRHSHVRTNKQVPVYYTTVGHRSHGYLAQPQAPPAPPEYQSQAQFQQYQTRPIAQAKKQPPHPSPPPPFQLIIEVPPSQKQQQHQQKQQKSRIIYPSQAAVPSHAPASVGNEAQQQQQQSSDQDDTLKILQKVLDERDKEVVNDEYINDIDSFTLADLLDILECIKEKRRSRLAKSKFQN